MTNTGTCVYRVYDAAGTLLYVGCTDRLPGRLTQHSTHSDWFSEVSDIRTEWFASRDQALRAETAAIFTEAPLHNVAGKSPSPAGETYADRVAHGIVQAIGRSGLSFNQVSFRSGIPFGGLYRHLRTDTRLLNVRDMERIGATLGVDPREFARAVHAA